MIDMTDVTGSEPTDESWAKNTLLKLFRVLPELSDFPGLSAVYKTLVTIAVSIRQQQNEQ
jgi:hypothetical protein